MAWENLQEEILGEYVALQEEATAVGEDFMFGLWQLRVLAERERAPYKAMKNREYKRRDLNKKPSQKTKDLLRQAISERAQSTGYRRNLDNLKKARAKLKLLREGRA